MFVFVIFFKRKYQDYFSVLQSINDRVAPIISKSRERERERKDRKDHDKDKKKDDEKQEKSSNASVKSDAEIKSESIDVAVSKVESVEEAKSAK